MTTSNQQTFMGRLQTAANKNSSATNYRKTIMIALATLTAITLVGQYVMLGTVGLGRSIGDLPPWFFITEKALWGLRGVVEIAVVIYVGMTITEKESEKKALSRFKFTLILLIILTVGPIWIASSLGRSITNTISVPGVYVWGAALAGISAVMLWAVSYAYTVQPHDIGVVVLPLTDYEKMLTVVGEAEAVATEARAAADTMRAERDRAISELTGMREAVRIFQFLPATAQVQIVALFANGLPPADELARTFRLSPSTVRGALAKVSSGVEE
jgi:hypothetical protein